jgi:hypothetical protein
MIQFRSDLPAIVRRIEVRLASAWGEFRHGRKMLPQAWKYESRQTWDLSGLSLEQRTRVDCAIFHDWSYHRGFQRCAICQPEIHKRRLNVLGQDITPETVTAPRDPTLAWAHEDLEGVTHYVDGPMWYVGERLVRVGGIGEPLGPQPDGTFVVDKLQEAE